MFYHWNLKNEADYSGTLEVVGIVSAPSQTEMGQRFVAENCLNRKWGSGQKFTLDQSQSAEGLTYMLED